MMYHFFCKVVIMENCRRWISTDPVPETGRQPSTKVDVAAAVSLLDALIKNTEIS